MVASRPWHEQPAELLVDQHSLGLPYVFSFLLAEFTLRAFSHGLVAVFAPPIAYDIRSFVATVLDLLRKSHYSSSFFIFLWLFFKKEHKNKSRQRIVLLTATSWPKNNPLSLPWYRLRRCERPSALELRSNSSPHSPINWLHSACGIVSTELRSLAMLRIAAQIASSLRSSAICAVIL